MTATINREQFESDLSHIMGWCDDNCGVYESMLVEDGLGGFYEDDEQVKTHIMAAFEDATS